MTEICLDMLWGETTGDVAYEITNVTKRRDQISYATFTLHTHL